VVDVTVKVTIDVNDLYACLNRARGLAGMSWRQVAAEVGCSPSTLTRMSHGHTPDAVTFLALVSWLRGDVEDFTDSTVPVSTAARIAMLEERIVDARAATDRERSERLSAQRKMETAWRQSVKAREQAEGWRLADAGHVTQLNIARDQLIANGIEPDRRIM
jgi:transcriptional regulator with XRE-family HTH domain